MKKAGASKPEVGIPELGKLKPSEAETAEAQARKQRAFVGVERFAELGL